MSISGRIELRHLRVFVAVAEEMSFRGAAERLSIAQPAISRTISDLEYQLHVRLFERTTRTVSLTEAGLSFLDESRALVGQLERAARITQNIGQGVQGRLTVAYMEFAIHDLVPVVLARFHALYPEIQVDLVYHWTDSQRQLLVDQSIDIGFMIGAFEGPNLDSCFLKRDRLNVILHTDDPLADRMVIHPHDLDGRPLVMGDRATWGAFRRIVDRVFRRARVIQTIGQEASTIVAVLGMVRAGLGVCVFAGDHIRYDLDGLTVRPLVTQGEVLDVHMLWSTTRKKAQIRNFVAVAQEVASDLFKDRAELPPRAPARPPKLNKEKAS